MSFLRTPQESDVARGHVTAIVHAMEPEAPVSDARQAQKRSRVHARFRSCVGVFALVAVALAAGRLRVMA